MAEARVAYRELARAIKTHITANDGNKFWQDYVRKQFRENAAEESARRSDKLIQLAKDCAFLINGVQEQRVNHSQFCVLQPVLQLKSSNVVP
jgi:hypothetical protein